MAELFSQYFSGIQFTAGAIVGSALGVSGVNPVIDRLNSISTDNNLVTGSVISGTSTEIHISGGVIGGIWSCAGESFKTGISGICTRTDGIYTNVSFLDHPAATLVLPNNATVVEGIVYGSPVNTNWYMRRTVISSGTVSNMAVAALSTADTSISSPVIDNATYCYHLVAALLPFGAKIYGAKIKYT